MHPCLIGGGEPADWLALRLAKNGIIGSRLGGMTPASWLPLSELAAALHLLPAPRCMWLFDHSGSNLTLARLIAHLQPNDLLIDQRVQSFEVTMDNRQPLANQGVHYVDLTVLGNGYGVEHGFACLAGGDLAAANAANPVLNQLAPVAIDGWLHCGGIGSASFIRETLASWNVDLLAAFQHSMTCLKRLDQQGNGKVPLRWASAVGRHPDLVCRAAQYLLASDVEDYAPLSSAMQRQVDQWLQPLLPAPLEDTSPARQLALGLGWLAHLAPVIAD